MFEALSILPFRQRFLILLLFRLSSKFLRKVLIANLRLLLQHLLLLHTQKHLSVVLRHNDFACKRMQVDSFLYKAEQYQNPHEILYLHFVFFTADSLLFDSI